jgi:hypothetical protein
MRRSRGGFCQRLTDGEGREVGAYLRMCSSCAVNSGEWNNEEEEKIELKQRDNERPKEK